MSVQEDAAAYEVLQELTTPRPIAEYNEDMGTVLWWKFPIEEPPYVGGPNDLGFTVEIEHSIIMRTHDCPEGHEHSNKISRMVGGWPGYHTHFTPIPIPTTPKQKET